MGESRWVDVTVEVEKGAGEWTRSTLAQVWGVPPTKIGKLDGYDQFTAIRLYGTQVTGDDPTNTTDQVALLLSVNRGKELNDTGIYPRQGAGNDVRLEWDGQSLRFILSGDELEDAINIDLWTPTPLAPRGVEVVKLRIALPFPYLKSEAGIRLYVATFDVDGFDSQIREPKPLKHVFETWSGNDLDGPWPMVLMPSSSNLVKSTYSQPSASFSRRLSFEQVGRVGDELVIYCAKLRLGSVDWREADKEPPALWPYDLVPHATAASEDLTSLEHVMPWAEGRTVEPAASWLLDVQWTQGPKLTPAAVWNRLIATHFTSLETVWAQTGGSVLPVFKADSTTKQHWRSTYRVRREVIQGDGDSKTYYRADRPRLGAGSAFELTAELRGLRRHDGKPLERTFRLMPLRSDASVIDDDSPDGDDPRVHHIAFDVVDTTRKEAPANELVRIGALDLGFAAVPAKQDPKDPEILDAGTYMLSGTLTGKGLLEPPRICAVNVPFAVGRVIPADQDPTEAEAGHARQGSVLVFDPLLTKQAPPSKTAHWVLKANERTASNHDHTFGFMFEPLQRSPATADPRKLIVLGDTPFFIAQVAFDPAALQSGSFGRASLEGPAWTLVDDGAPATMRLPPQILGEEMIKDYDGAPYTPDPSKKLRHKLSRTAELRVDRKVISTSAAEPAWNVNRLFGWPRRTVPGSKLSSLTTELLYGLETTVDAPGLRVLELFASIGDMRTKKRGGGRGGDDGFLSKEQRAREQLASRLMYLHLAVDKQPYPSALIEDGISFRFRPERQVAHPLKPKHNGTNGKTTWTSVDDGGLAGGVDWGFESLNVYDEVIESPGSTSGRLVSPALTALGGFGFQKAGFANDKSRIYSDAALGRTTYYALERIGRIGVLWHPAKHVIVYERTVAASQQFPEHGKVNKWRGRPVVRKVREYVELLEDKRSYPDDDSPETTRGAMLAAAFLDRIIPVDSKWGRDIPGGWVVPLYRHGADPAVYPVPRVQLQLATSAEPVWKPHDEPEKLVFYTSTNRTHDANPSSWPPAPGVDFPYATIPMVDVTGKSEPGDEARLPDAPSIDAAYEQFTYRLGGVPSAIDIAAGRGRSAIEAKLHNITLARRSLVEAVDSAVTDAWKKPHAALVKYSEEAQEAARALRLTADLDAFKQSVHAARAKASTALASATDVMTELVRRQTDYLHSWPREFDDVLRAAKLRIEELAREGKTAERDVTAVINDLGRRLSSIQLVAIELDNRIRAAMRAYTEAGTQIETTIVDLQNRLQDLAATPERMKQEAVRAVAQLTSRVQHAVEAAAQLGATKVRVAVKTFLDDAGARIAETNLDVTKLVEHARALKNTLTPMVADLETVAMQLPIGKAQEVEAVLADFLALEGNPLARQALADSAAFLRQFDKLVADTRGAVRTKVEDANTLLKAIEGPITDVLGQVKAIDQSVNDELAAWLRFAGQVQANVKTELDSILATVGDRIGHQLAQQRAFVEHTIHHIAEQVAGDVTKLGDRAMRFVRAWGETPVASGLAYTRDRVAYFFHEKTDDVVALAQRVTFTPVTALVNRIGQDIPGLDLHTIGMRLPTFSLDERLIPDLRKALDLSKLFPDIAGLKLDGLFSNVKLPTVEADGLQVKHGFDRARRSAWVRADVDVRVPPSNIFSFGPFAMKLHEARFVAQTEVVADPSGIRRTTKARVSGDWRFEIGGQLVAALEQTKLELDDAGKLHFNINPKSIRVAEALRMLTQLLQYAPSGAGSGLSIGPVIEGSLPVGVRAALNLALPSLQSGAFSISNLSLATHFQIAMTKGAGFELSAGLGFATPDRPFNLSVLFLGGGGWFTTAVSWAFSGGPVVDVDLGLAAGASLPFDIGVAKGGVWLLLSVGVRWRSRGPFSITLAISLRGEVVILSIVSVSLYLRLQARYISGGNGLECSGHMSLTIKIGWFFKISVSHHVTFTLAGSGGGATKALDDSALDDHLDSYEPDHV